jgi:hypothetical protein
MAEEPTLAEKARAAIRSGQLPSRAPNRRFGGRGNGATCPVCGEVVTPIQAEIELEFNRHGPEPGLDRYHRPVLHRVRLRAPQDSRLGDVAQYHR